MQPKDFEEEERLAEKRVKARRKRELKKTKQVDQIDQNSDDEIKEILNHLDNVNKEVISLLCFIITLQKN